MSDPFEPTSTFFGVSTKRTNIVIPLLLFCCICAVSALVIAYNNKNAPQSVCACKQILKEHAPQFRPNQHFNTVSK